MFVALAAVFALAAAGVLGIRLIQSRRERSEVAPYDPAPGDRYAHLWGYRDTRFEFIDPRTVHVTGHRYPLAGPPLPAFVDFAEEIFALPFGPELVREPEPPAQIAPPRRHAAFIADLEQQLGGQQMSDADAERLVHSHGQLSVDEVYRIVRGQPPERLVDLVVWPESEADVLALVHTAERHDVALIPYGGGTNVSGALLCPADEARTIVSVDMRRMERIITIDRANNCALVEAGITGKELERQLAAEGLTCGHVPDSIEFSTLGGWIATAASGMKKNRYGNIEEVVLDATLVTPRGEVRSFPTNPRASMGIEPRRLLFGSEGMLGIITRAVVQVHPLPETRRYDSFVFPDFERGLAYLKAVQASGVRPASIRLANNMEFRLGQALGRERGRLHALLNRLKKFYLFRVKRLDPKRMVAGTLVMEGSREEVRRQRRTLTRLVRACGGLSGGAENGRRGYQVTFAIAYIRDFLNRLDILGETFETSAPWDRVVPITTAVQAELERLCDRHGVPGHSFLSYRVSQSYHSGVCIYFTMGFCGRGLERPDEVYQRIERRLREVILDEGGSLSHHHGIGKVRQGFLDRSHSPAAMEALRELKRALDPRNIFAAGNNVFGVTSRREPDLASVSRDAD